MSRTLEAIRERIRARQALSHPVKKAKKVVVRETVEVEAEPSYRDLQAQAKELDIPANQSADDLTAAIEEASEA